jgi:hypothetical protein
MELRMDLERAMEFLLEQQAAFQARFDARAEEQQARADAQQARFDAQMASITAKQDRVSDLQGKTEAALRRAIRLSVVEHRRERVRRREADLKLAEADATLSQKIAELTTEQALTQRSLRAFIDSLKQPRNGHENL